jgi:hypothetical protein
LQHTLGYESARGNVPFKFRMGWRGSHQQTARLKRLREKPKILYMLMVAAGLHRARLSQCG